MLTLKVDDIPDEGLTLRWAEQKASLSAYLGTFSDIDFDFETPLESEARIEKVGQSLLIKGGFQTELRLRCVRCLKEFTYPLSSTFQLSLLPARGKEFAGETELEGEDMESSFFEGGEIHLSEIACEQVFLEIPYQPICREDCKGLCPACGKDLNIESCTCAKEKSHSEFSVLEKLKLDHE